MNILKNKKNWIIIFTIGIIGILAGFIIAANLNVIPSATSNPQSITSPDKDIATGLSRSFIKVAKAVTPSVVTIVSTKIIKNSPQQKFNFPFEDFFGDDDFFKHFQSPETPQQYRSQGMGSGVIIKDDGTILTNNHVISEANEIKITLSDKRTFSAKLIGTDPKTDVAVIKIDKKVNDLKPAILGDSDKLEVGEWVLAIGNPFGLKSTVTSGIISFEGRGNVGVADFEDFIQTDAAINPGNSGGALVNLSGEVIGINTAIASKTGGYMGIGFAIPINMAKKVMDALITKGKVTRGYLGVRIQDMTEEFAKNLKLESTSKGIVVGDVIKDSPAARAGLKPYDVIMKLNGQDVDDINHFRNTIAITPPNTEVALIIWRDGSNMDIKVRLAELKGEETDKVTDQEEEAKDLGFKVKEITPDIAKQLNIDSSTKGCVVIDVQMGSSAMEAGLRKGDIIKEINRQRIKSLADFKNVTGKLKKGDSILLQVQREEGTLLIGFTID